ncbi:uncharacterized protein LOC106133086 [Amyelois transitella]|uniref:uncharacterized protein LOC106133086 n=1 Tax=Amyelois transitella TaxID=680683 RepID=UPI00299008FD|nr:uncharacterized protein LOC106133086 [Amyelois transitella]
MKAVFYLVLLGLGGVVTDLAGECDMAGFYLELGCSAVPKTDNSTICPDAFQCPDLHPDPTKCYYKGVPYKDRSNIPQNIINNPCSQACSCQVSGGPRFECAAVDCVETFDVDLQQQCISTYDLESCCSTGTVCGTDAIAALKTCEVDGKTYRVGEAFEPKNTRKTCICTGEWNGSTEGAYCRDISCGLEIHYQDMVAQNCAPVFVRNTRSCPIAFQCPSPTSKVVRGLNRRGVNSECSFGNMTLSVGDEVTVGETCMRCSCEVPPFVTCTKQVTCDN